MSNLVKVALYYLGCRNSLGVPICLGGPNSLGVSSLIHVIYSD